MESTIPLSILIVEDKAFITNAIKSAIVRVAERYSGVVSINLDFAKSFKVALKKIQDNIYGVIFLDHEIFEYEGDEITASVGYDLIKVIRERSKYTTILGTSSEHSEIAGKYGITEFKISNKGDSEQVETQLTVILEGLKGTK